MSRGIDLSNNNGHADWPALAAAGYKYALCKATEGLSFVDGFYEENRAGAAAHGIAFGAYHFFAPGEDPRAQVEFFLKHATPKTGDIVPSLDYERPPADRAPAEQFVTALHNDLGHWPMFYTFLSFVQSMRIPAASPLARCPLWLADFTGTRPATPAPWHEITIWQHSSTGRVPGVGGPVDLDAGSPTVLPAAKPHEWDITFHDKTGAKRRKRVGGVSGGPGRWFIRHPNPKYNGRIIIDPVRPK